MLCDLEGLTHEEAAAQLCWPVGTVKGRLSRAREKLRSRLTRRGLAPASFAAAPTLLRRDVPSFLSVGLIEQTVRASMFVAAGDTTAVGLGLISTRAAALAEGVLHAMSLTLLKAAAVSFVLVGTVLTGAGVHAYQSAGEPAPKTTGTKTKIVTPPSVLPDLDANTRDMIQQYFARVLQVKKPWTSNDVESVYRWSKAMMGVEGIAARDWKEVETAQDAHVGRMKQLGGLVAKLNAPDQSALSALTDRAIAAAERDLVGSPLATLLSRKPAPEQVGQEREPVVAQRERPVLGIPEGGAGATDEEPQDKLRIKNAGLASRVARADKSPRTKAILKKLDEPISMNFAKETPLEDVLKYICTATQGSDDSGILSYVDPAGLQDAEKTMSSPVMLELEGVPLRTTLRLLLKQLNLAYCVEDGMLFISTPQGIQQELMEWESAQPEPEISKGGFQ